MPLPKDWRAFIESLNSNGVEYLIVGAVALEPQTSQNDVCATREARAEAQVSGMMVVLAAG